MSVEPSSDAFRDFEQTGWEEAASEYQRFFGPLTAQSIGPLLDAAGVAAGTRVLDVATGMGYVAAAAATRGANVIGLDFAAVMLAEARRRHPGIEFRLGDAEALPFDDATFDAVVMNYGLLHLGQPEQALAEARRVLRVGGRVAYTVWADPTSTVPYAIVLGAIREHGRLDVPLPIGPPFFRFSDPAESRRTLLSVGFADPTVTTLEQTWHLPSPDGLFDAMRTGTVRTAGLLRAQTPAALATIRDAIRQAARPYDRDGTLVLPMPAVLASAHEPE